MRRAESVRRSTRQGYEIVGKTRKDTILLNDNVDERRSVEYCMQKNAYICNPIIDWSEEDVWNFIRHNNLPYCSLYDEGYTRLGCIGCPMGSTEQRERDFARYPKYADCYKRAFDKMLKSKLPNGHDDWKTGEDVFKWWIYGEKALTKEQEETLFDLDGMEESPKEE